MSKDLEDKKDQSNPPLLLSHRHTKAKPLSEPDSSDALSELGSETEVDSEKASNLSQYQRAAERLKQFADNKSSVFEKKSLENELDYEIPDNAAVLEGKSGIDSNPDNVEKDETKETDDSNDEEKNTFFKETTGRSHSIFSMRQIQKQVNKKSPFKGLSVEDAAILGRKLIGILSTLSVGILVVLYFISPLSKVSSVNVLGIDKVTEEEVIELSQIEVGQPVWPQYFDKKMLMNRLVEGNPRIESANLKLKNLNHFYVTINEYETVAVLKEADITYPVLSSGTILKEVVSDSENDYAVIESFDEGDSLENWLKAYQKLPESIQSEILVSKSEATETNPYRVRLTMRDGNEVVGLSTTLADKILFYDKIVSEMDAKGVIDMEAGASGVFSYPFETSDTGLESEIEFQLDSSQLWENTTVEEEYFSNYE